MRLDVLSVFDEGREKLKSVSEAAKRFWVRDGGSDYPYGQAGQRLEEALVTELVARGVDPAWIKRGRNATLPMAQGVDRSWDLVISKDSVPLAAIVWKASSAASFRKNMRNHMQELSAIAADVRMRYGHPDLYRIRPHLDFIFIEEERQERIALPGRGGQHARVEVRSSTLSRVSDHFYERLIETRLYDNACYIVSNGDPESAPSQPHRSMELASFIEQLAEDVLVLAARQERDGITLNAYFELLSKKNDINHLRTQGDEAAFEEMLSSKLTEDALFELKQGFCTVNDPTKFDDRNFDKILKIASAMANTGTGADGVILVGVADDAQDAAAIKRFSSVNSIEVGGFHVTGTRHEIDGLGRSIDEHFRWLVSKIRTAKLTPRFAEELASSLTPFTYKGYLLWRIDIRAMSTPVTYDGKFYVRSGPGVREVSGDAVVDLVRKFDKREA
ncbi:PaeR7I family type II restriction endonuclease [Streptomyces globisporus]|uniref:PaeR7I family type II restriction endonuclease n=1 Tax=Streptomyces globisporus TaxID=1908 RepID=UPI000997C0B2|nr:PaeR7I family type II restriction endonuclease [Streptomyces globisporus]